jgi:hypothetical protein
MRFRSNLRYRVFELLYEGCEKGAVLINFNKVFL